MTDFAFSRMAPTAPSSAGQAGAELHRTWESATARRAGARRTDRRDYRLMWAVAFLFFLVVALVSRLLPARRRIEVLGARRSILGDARALTNSTIPIAFGA